MTRRSQNLFFALCLGISGALILFLMATFIQIVRLGQ